MAWLYPGKKKTSNPTEALSLSSDKVKTPYLIQNPGKVPPIQSKGLFDQFVGAVTNATGTTELVSNPGQAIGNALGVNGLVNNPGQAIGNATGLNGLIANPGQTIANATGANALINVATGALAGVSGAPRPLSPEQQLIEDAKAEDKRVKKEKDEEAMIAQSRLTARQAQMLKQGNVNNTLLTGPLGQVASLPQAKRTLLGA